MTTARKSAPERPFARRKASLFPAVIGCDEVGRGALCGPVMVAAVWFEPQCLPKGVLGRLDDSKKLTREEREALYPLIMGCARVAFAARSARAIDLFGIRTMTLDAMRAAIRRLAMDAPVRIDGVDVPRGLSGDAMAVVRGDGKVPQIAAASILAKVMRDRLMARLAMRHSGYAWDRNAGYGTAAHRDAILRLGSTGHHRRSFGDLFSSLAAPPEPAEIG
ncbi:ribonuclease HII [Sphingomonas oleivorans]|uniref:Ribonuclease n=1 Tax=Sphingomonas oleivorans TaxID=1735121 RepID=A0A2T5G056_9SPHN|nr:ribonuclease HII [Sphingomonas oleivorans]PTQ12325.1 ribonuclease HII [Sphingomonas oleivorans]